ncbi:MAG: head-tail adaptor protein [Alphaproteobacteria bacterium]|nr:head-tail adaptor protein [Alphaproteobacteria bacterium]MBO6629147.1 head-tail adaptor protein [Alphaproteobacteria bacterium]
MWKKSVAPGAGALDQTITVKRRTDVSDGQGGSNPTTATLGTVKVHVEPVRGQELVIADRKAGVQTYRLTGRSAGIWSGLLVSDLLVWNGVELNVVSVPDVGRVRYLTVEAQSGVVNS